MRVLAACFFVALSAISSAWAQRPAANPGGAPGVDTVVSAYRAIVADGASGAVHVVDLATGRVRGTYNVASPARLHGGANARYVYLVQNAAGRVGIVDTGIDVHDHGDHVDIKVSNARLLTARLEGPKPVHFNRGGGRIAVFFDGDGTSQSIRERDLVQGNTSGMRRVESGGAHHGVAKPFGTALALSRPSTVANQTLPDRIDLLGPDGRVLAGGACPRAHGEAALGADLIAFGCADGIRLFERRGTQAVTRHIPYAADLPGERMVRNMEGALGMRLIFADFGPDGMVVVDPTGAGEFNFVQLPARRMSFALAPDPGNRGYVMVEDGRMLQIDTVQGKIVAEAKVTDRYSMESGVLRPRLDAVGPYVVVSDPAAGEVVVLDAASMRERRRIVVGGTPFDIAAVGGSGKRH